MRFYVSDYKDYDKATEKEWLLTNGLGGYAASTLIGANTRRYHSLLTVAKDPPGDRTLIVSKLDDALIFRDTEISLSSQRSNGHIICGFCHLHSVEIGDRITYTYMVRQTVVRKTIEMIWGQDRIRVTYTVRNKGEGPVIRMTPLLNSRYFHFINKKDDITVSGFSIGRERFTIGLNDIKGITFEYTGCRFTPSDDKTFYSMEYDMERRRGLDYIEDHFMPGYIWKETEGYGETSFTIDIYVGAKGEVPAGDGTYKEGSYRDRLEKACSDFIVYRRSTDSPSIIAGYPWFEDWGRDALISLPGLLLETGRYDTAKKILRTYAGYEKDGLIPNMLPNGREEASYGTADTSLWFIHAVNETCLKTGDGLFLKDGIMSVMKNIISAYREGTSYDIKADEDGLVSAGNEFIQLTWMDAKVGDFMVTPRYGKIVEINALWYNALCIMFRLTDDRSYLDLALKAYRSFNEKFVDTEGRSLYDFIDAGFEKKRSGDLRPNGIFSISLPYPVLAEDKWKMIFERINNELYTPYGLRSLSYLSRDYRGYYGGDQFERDTAYHQGTAWAWLIGAFAEAYLKIYGDRQGAYELIEPLLGHLDKAMVNSVGEIFEGSFPHRERGSTAQAWSVAELLRIYNKIKGE